MFGQQSLCAAWVPRAGTLLLQEGGRAPGGCLLLQEFGVALQPGGLPGGACLGLVGLPSGLVSPDASGPRSGSILWLPSSGSLPLPRPQ